MESTALTHLYAENKRLNELVVQLVAECHERVSTAKYAEVDLVNQVLALREECDSLRSENEVLKHTPTKSDLLGSEERADQLSDGYTNDERRKRRDQLLEKLQDLNTALDGLSSHGSHLHKMVTSSFHKPAKTNLFYEPAVYTPSANVDSVESSFQPTKSSLFYEPAIYTSTADSIEFSPNKSSTIPNILPSSFSKSSIPTIPRNVSPSLPSPDSTITGEQEVNNVEHDILAELDCLQSLLSPLWVQYGNETVVFSRSAKSIEEELAILEEMFEYSVQYSKNPHVPLLALSSEIPAPNASPSPRALSFIPPPPPPPPILISPPPITLGSPRIQKRGERKQEEREARGGLLAGILAVRPNSDARLLSAAKFQKERLEKKEDDIEGEKKSNPLSHMDRLMRALKRVKVDSNVRMAAITQVEQEVQTRLKTVRSDRLITDTMISQQKGQLKTVGGIAALEEARMKKLEALRAQYREESLSLSHSFAPPTDIYERYETSEEEYSDEDEGEEEGGLASIVQGLIRTNSLREEEDSMQDDEYYSEDDEDDTLFESLGQLVHERFANRNYIPVSEIP